MIDLKAFQKNVVKIVSMASGLPNNKIQVTAGGRLPEIKGPYCTAQLMGDRTIGHAALSYADSGTENVLDENVNITTEFTLSLNFYRDGAQQYAHNMKSGGVRSDIQSLRWTSGISWLSFGPINGLTGLFSGFNEERAQANLRLVAQGVDTRQVNQALTVDVDLHGDWIPEIETFYAYTPQAGNDMYAWDNQI